jgi:hypothetical protein
MEQRQSTPLKDRLIKLWNTRIFGLTPHEPDLANLAPFQLLRA